MARALWPYLVACLLLAACHHVPAPKPAASTPARGPSLYDRLGRMDVIGDVAVDLVEVQLPASSLAPHVVDVDRSQLEDGLARWLCELAGGPCHYPGRSLRELHPGMAITAADLEAFLDALERSLVHVRIAPDVRADLLSVVRGERDSIVAPP